MRRFFVSQLSDEAGAEIAASADTARHLQVLRLEPGAEVALFDGTGLEVSATLRALDPPVFQVVARRRYEQLAELELVQVVPKGSKLDGITRMATELGVTRLTLASSERSLSVPSSAKLQRLARIASEAARQSGRAQLPHFSPTVIPLKALPAPAADGLGLVCWESAADPLPHAQLAELRGQLSVVVGPEGGLSHAEVSALEARGYLSIGLPTPILRVETAGPAVLAMIQLARSVR